jgi:hypothetical protein
MKMTGSLWLTMVCTSITGYPFEPSPMFATTGLSEAAALAPITVGMPNPTSPNSSGVNKQGD